MFEKSIIDNNSNGNKIGNDYKKVKMHDCCFIKKRTTIIRKMQSCTLRTISKNNDSAQLKTEPARAPQLKILAVLK